MSCARVAIESSTKIWRAGPGSTVGWPPRNSPTISATRAQAAAMMGVRKRGFIRPVRVARARKARLNPEEAAQRETTAERADEHARGQQDRHEQPEVDRVRSGKQAETLGQRVDEGLLTDRQQ